MKARLAATIGSALGPRRYINHLRPPLGPSSVRWIGLDCCARLSPVSAPVARSLLTLCKRLTEANHRADRHQKVPTLLALKHAVPSSDPRVRAVAVKRLNLFDIGQNVSVTICLLSTIYHEDVSMGTVQFPSIDDMNALADSYTVTTSAAATMRYLRSPTRYDLCDFGHK